MSVLDAADVMDVEGYAAAVRRALVGLGPEQIEDLTDDLEADLADALADERHNAHGRGVLEQFGPPEEYAAELRSAAGLAPVVDEPVRRRARDWLAAPVHGLRRGGRWLLGKLREQPVWAPVESFLVVMRPVWWLVRAWIGYEAFALWSHLDGSQFLWLPRVFLGWLIFAAAVVVSVQWGRGAWLQGPRVRWIAVVANLVAVVALVPLAGAGLAITQRHADIYQAYTYGAFNNQVDTQVVYKDRPVDGVVVDGIQVSNLFAYDAEGNPLNDVQIFDDRGRPVRTTFDNGADQWYFPESNEPWSFVSREDADGRNRWNVYPLQGAPTSEFTFADDGTHALVDGTSASVPPRPFAKAPALDAAAQSSVAADSPSSTSEAGPTPTPTP